MTTDPGTAPRSFPADSEAGDGGDGAVRAAVARLFPAAIAELAGLVRIPSVSWSTYDPDRVAESARAVAALLESVQLFDEVRIERAPTPTGELGQPAVLATRRARGGKPTVLLYAHHDIQPAGEEALWDSPAFEPTVRDDRLYGRGAADDKAGVIAHVTALRTLHTVTDGDPDLGLVVFIEGEEEFGSRSFGAFLEAHRERMAAEVVIVADSDNWDSATPSLTVSLRGNVTFKLTVSTLEHASHSGMYGGAAPDAMLALVKLLATLHDDHGAVAVEGLDGSDQSVPDFDEEQFRRDAALLPGVQPIGRGPLLERLWAQPSITITGIDAPSVPNASNTLLPSVSVRVSVRIAPGQDPDASFEALQAHLHAHTPFGANLRIEDVDKGEGFLVDTTGWAVAEATRAMRDAWGAEPKHTGVGGSIPFVADLAKMFPDAQILITGVEDPVTRAHSPNESLHLGVFSRAILTEALFLSRLNNAAQR